MSFDINTHCMLKLRSDDMDNELFSPSVNDEVLKM